MALKDNIRHFRDVDNYTDVIKNEDIDDNFDLLADNIDNEVTRATDVEGDITTLQTTNKDSLTSAINEIVSEINTPFENDDLNSLSIVYCFYSNTKNITKTI